MNRRSFYQRQPSAHWQNHANHYQQSSYTSQPQQPPIKQPTPYEIYAKPAQPMDWFQSGKQAANTAGNPGSFTDNNGQIEFDKLLSSINQVAGTYHQVSPIVKQLGSLVKMFRQ